MNPDEVSGDFNLLGSLEVIERATRMLDRDSLRAMGLEAGDSGASDHLPVVVDLAPWP